MRSGNGRHRRPRQAPAIVVAAGVTGSAIAIPLLGAGSASAADASTWDRVAECESGGMWSADLGNGYYGGLQISEEIWQNYGGTDYAARADLASRSQQIAVAERVLDAQGPEAWPGCAAMAGLRNDGAVTGVDPGAGTTLPLPGASTAPTASTLSAKPSDGATGTAPPKGATGEAADTAGSAEAASSATTGDDQDSESAGGKHRGEAATEGVQADAVDDEREAGRHASRSDGPTRDEAGETDKGGSEGAEPGEYTVRAGDSLSAIVDEQKLDGGWTALYAANRATVGTDPDLIIPGQSLDLDLEPSSK